jgi:hypothetical protein
MMLKPAFLDIPMLLAITATGAVASIVIHTVIILFNLILRKHTD